MHRVKQAEKVVEEVQPSEELGYVILKKFSNGDWCVVNGPFKEVRVFSDFENAAFHAQADEYILPIPLPKVSE
jgi:hypothetical protein